MDMTALRTEMYARQFLRLNTYFFVGGFDDE